jgi:general secretion pathway protein I
MHASNSSRTAGFTLLEVLAALVIVSLGMLAVIEAIGQTASNSTRMRDRTIAHWVAMNRLTAARLEPRAPKIDKTSDEVEMAGRRWRWTMEVSETPVKTMFRIDVRVAEAEAEADDDRSLAQVTGFYGSAIAAAGMLTPSWSGAPIPGASPGTEQAPTDESKDQTPGGSNEEPSPNEPPGDIPAEDMEPS